MLKMVAFVPHPPIVIPEVGKSEAEKVSFTAGSMQKIAQEINTADPEIIVAITPHGHVFSDAVTITAIDILEGDLGQFGAPQVKVKFELDREAVAAILDEGGKGPVLCAALDEQVIKQNGRSVKLDHGLVVPLSFVAKAGWRGRLVPVNMGFLPYEELYHFGRMLRKGLDKLGKPWALLTSGDMSHSLLPGAPAGYSSRGAVFDEIIRQCVREGDVKRIFSLDHDLIEDAAECGLRPLIMALGVCDGYEIEAKELSYEGPFGVGYLVEKIISGRKSPERELYQDLYEQRKEKINRNRKEESEPVRLARASIRNYLTRGTYVETPQNKELSEEKAGAFVSLKKHNQLRGCIGTIEPVRENLAKEIIYNAVSAALHDPRFEPLQLKELDDVTISVDVLQEPEPISGMDELDPSEYGVIVSKGLKRGLLLPHLAGINTPEEQVRIARQKAGISPEEAVELERFKVVRYT